MRDRIKYSLPNFLTLINLSLGVIALLFVMKNDLLQASLIVMVAALTDRFDGKTARMLDCTSELGKELDSLSDLVSFGVAPIIITWKISFFGLPVIGCLLAVIYPIAGAYRLARYNLSTFNNVYSGVPITIAGALLSVINMFNYYSIEHHRYNSIYTVFTAVIVILLSFLMVSKIRIQKR